MLAKNLDSDGINNFGEYTNCTDPSDEDTDHDGLSDLVETGTGVFSSATDTGTDPLDPDTDGDTLGDALENNSGVFGGATNPGTNPLLADTDGDGFDDNIEIELGYNPTNPDSRPVLPLVIGYWSFDDQSNPTADLSRSGNDATVNGNPVFVPGPSGRPTDFAISFDGLDDFVTTNVSLLSRLTEFTMCGWVKFDASQAARAGLFGQNDGIEFGMLSATTLQHWSAAGAAIDTPLGPTTPWVHILVTGNATERAIYFDGVRVMSGAPSTAPVSTFPFNIGGGGIFDATGNFFLGEIDEVAVWDTVLTAEQIAQLASGELTPIGPPGQDRIVVTRISHDPAADTTGLTWESSPGERFEIRKTLDLASDPETWAVLRTQVPAASAPAETTTEIVDTSATEVQAFYKIFQVPPPPVFQDDFETDQGWITGVNGANSDTLWQRGAPTNVGPLSGANGSANCFGTNLSADYGLEADIFLRSPAIDLTGPDIAAATLRFEQFRDMEGFFDYGTVRVLRASDNSLLGEDVLSQIDDFALDWERVTAALPPEAIGEIIRLEFQFISDEAQSYGGWYIDDVVVVPE